MTDLLSFEATRRGLLRAAAGIGALAPLSGELALALEPAGDDGPLRGVAVGDAVLARAGRPADDYAFLARDWRATVVRLSLHPGVWLQDRDAARAAVEREVAAARAAGLSVILVWHAIGWPDGAEFHPDPEWGMPARSYATDLALAHEFWTTMARRYAEDDAVVFEIWNEPVRLDAPDFLSPAGEDWPALREIWVELIRTIRAHAQNRILATGGGWASDLTGIRAAPLPDARTGYAWHVYPGTGGGDPQRIAALLDELPADRPVWVTEWGFGGDSHHLQGDRHGFGAMFASQFLEAYRLPWTAWCWHPDWEPRLVEPDWRTPTEAGAYVRERLVAT